MSCENPVDSQVPPTYICSSEDFPVNAAPAAEHDTSEKQFPSLPTELWSRVATELTFQCSSQPALYALSLVSTRLSHIVAPHLYARPYLDGFRQTTRFLRSLSLSTHIASHHAAAADPHAVLESGEIHDKASLVRRLDRTFRTPDGWIGELMGKCKQIEELPRGFWASLTKHGDAAILAYKNTLTSMLICQSNKDGLLGIAKTLERESERWSPTRHVKTLEDMVKGDEDLAEGVGALLPTDRRISSLFLFFPSLRRLIIHDLAITAVPNHVVRLATKCLVNLEAVALVSSEGHSRFDSQAVRSLWECPHLHELVLEHLDFTDENIGLNDARRLRVLRLRRCNIGAFGLEAVRNAPFLEVLELVGCTFASIATFEAWASPLEAIFLHLPPTLRGLRCSHFRWKSHSIPAVELLVTDAAQYLAERCTNLVALQLEGVCGLTPTIIAALLAKMSRLRSLYLNNALEPATDEHIRIIATLPLLRRLHYVPRPSPNTDPLTFLRPYSAAARQLPDMHSCITNATATSLIKLPRLRSLALDVVEITDDGWATVLKGCKVLGEIIGTVEGRSKARLRRAGVRVLEHPGATEIDEMFGWDWRSL